MINTMVQSIGFFIFTFSDFLFVCIKSINLHFPIFTVLNNITMTYIIPKYIIVLIHAWLEKINSYFVISASNIFATNILISCESNTPSPNPTANDIIPIKIVSKNSIIDIFLLLIPKSIYIPNSLFLLFIKNLLAYIIRNPRINATNTLAPDNIFVIKSITSCVLFVTSNSTVWLSILLNT